MSEWCSFDVYQCHMCTDTSNRQTYARALLSDLNREREREGINEGKGEEGGEEGKGEVCDSP